MAGEAQGGHAAGDPDGADGPVRPGNAGHPSTRVCGTTPPPGIPGAPVSRLPVFAALFLLFILWSNSFHAIAYFRTDLAVSATGLVILRYGPVAVFCLLWCAFRAQSVAELWRRDGWRVLAMGFMMVPAYNLALNWGQGRVPPATASLVIALNPVFTFLLALLLLGERARWTRLAGMALSFLGVYLLVSYQGSAFGGGYTPYALVTIAAPLSWALATVLGKPVTERSDPLLVTFVATGLGSLPFLIGLGAGTEGVHDVLRSLTATGWIALIHLSVNCTIIGFAVWFWALRRLPASTVAAFVFLNPPMTAAFGILWGTEAFHWSTVVFGSVTLAGVALSSGVLRRTRRVASH